MGDDKKESDKKTYRISFINGEHEDIEATSFESDIVQRRCVFFFGDGGQEIIAIYSWSELRGFRRIYL